MVPELKFFPYTARGLYAGVIFYAIASVLTWGILKWTKRKGIYEVYVFCAVCSALGLLSQFRLEVFLSYSYNMMTSGGDLGIKVVSVMFFILFVSVCAIIFRFFLIRRQLNDFLALGSSLLILIVLLFEYRFAYYKWEMSAGMLAAIWYYVTRIPVQPTPEKRNATDTQ
jgi:hypothetical protein